jgi:hypothetical protein
MRLNADIQRIAFIGAHGSGKSYLAEKVSPVLGLATILSLASEYFKSIDKKLLRDMDTAERFLHQYGLMLRAGVYFAENKIGLFERSPLDILAYTEMLILEADEQDNKTTPIMDYLYYSDMKKELFRLTETYVDVLVYVPIAEEILNLRQEETSFKELKSNAVKTDQYMRQIIGEFYKTTRTRTKYIHLHCQPEDRVEYLLDSLNQLSKQA